jgi:hypothetical protein
VDEAALMLESGDDAIARIATRVGYETTTAFSKAFKHTTQAAQWGPEVFSPLHENRFSSCVATQISCQ